MLQTTSTERRAAGGDRPRSGESVKRRPASIDGRFLIDFLRALNITVFLNFLK